MKSRMEKQDILLFGCLLFLAGLGVVAGGYYLQHSGRLGQIQGVMATPTPTPRKKYVVINKPKENVKQVMDAGKNLYNRLAAEPQAKQVTLIDVIGSNTSASGYYLRTAGKLYVALKVNVPTAEKGTGYEGWLIQEYPRRKFVSLGQLEEDGPGAYLLATTISPTYPDFPTIVITLEEKMDRTPERYVLQGTLE